MGMREADLETLESARMQIDIVAAARARCNEIVPNGRYKSPSFAGMPGGGGPCGLDGSAKACEELLARLEAEERKLKRLKKMGEKAIARANLKAEQREFCRGYYLMGLSIRGAMERLGMSERTGWDYKAKIEMCRRPKKQAHTRKNRAKNTSKNLQ